MKVFLILVTWYFYFIKIIDSKIYQVQLTDELYPYSIDQTVPFYSDYFSHEHLTFEQIDDDVVKIGGYPVCIKSMDPKLPIQFAVRSQYRENSIWFEGPLRLIIPDICTEFLNPSRFYYNFTKLWTNCPAQKGDKWLIESQIVNEQFDLPPSLSKGPWRAYFLFTQGLFGAVTKFGLMVELEFVDIV